MNTIARVMELADERDLSLFKLSQLCDVSYSTLKNAEMRGSQLGFLQSSVSAPHWGSH